MEQPPVVLFDGDRAHALVAGGEIDIGEVAPTLLPEPAERRDVLVVAVQDAGLNAARGSSTRTPGSRPPRTSSTRAWMNQVTSTRRGARRIRSRPSRMDSARPRRTAPWAFSERSLASRAAPSRRAREPSRDRAPARGEPALTTIAPCALEAADRAWSCRRSTIRVTGRHPARHQPSDERDGLRCASAGLAPDERSEDRAAAARGTDGTIRTHRAHEPDDALRGLVSLFERRSS